MNEPLSSSEREKLIEQLITLMDKAAPGRFFSYKIIAEAIVDAGWRPTKESNDESN